MSFPFFFPKNNGVSIFYTFSGQQFMNSRLTVDLLDTAIVAFTLIRILEGRVTIDDLSRNTSLDTGFTSTCHSIVAGRTSFMAAKMGV